VLDGARSVLVLEEIVDHTNVGVHYDTTVSRIAVLEDFVDHANVGALYRNAAAMGVGGVLLSPRCADPLYRRAVKVSMGAVLQMPWTRFEAWPSGLAQLRDEGYTLAAMTLSDRSITLDELAAQGHKKLALVFGTEGHGLRPRTLDECDVHVRIPMDAGIDSLNVAAASAVAFYATRR
jgi:tRNA G18 (ribose-2'-O)-methylase SpoU